VNIHEISLGSPTTICTSKSCVEFIRIETNGRPIIHRNYKKLCHSHCSRGKKKYWEIVGLVGNKKLQKCSAFEKDTGRCKICGCYWELHMKADTISIAVVSQHFDKDSKDKLEQIEDEIERKKVSLKQLENRLVELKNEQNEITTATVKFACYLRENCTTPYNEAILLYLEHFIHEEENNVACGGNTHVLHGLMKMRQQYTEEIKLLEKAIKEGTKESANLEELQQCVGKLLSLKLSGPKLQQIVNATLSTASTCPFIEHTIRRGEPIRRSVIQIEKLANGSGVFGFNGTVTTENSAALVPAEPTQFTKPKTMKGAWEEGIADVKSFISKPKLFPRKLLSGKKTGEKSAIKVDDDNAGDP